MTTARSKLVDTSVTKWYHCISRCVQRAFLLAEGSLDRKQWIEDRLEELAEIFAISVAGFSILDNHLHVLLRIDSEIAASWSDEEVVQRWGRLFPPRDRNGHRLQPTREWIEWRLADAAWTAETRQKLSSLSWFTKCLKEPLSRMANREVGARGAFFEGRFKSVAILDEESLLSTCAYIDLNPVAAGIAALPEASAHTSIKRHVEHVEDQGRTNDIRVGERGTVPAQAASSDLEDAHWLCPIEDRQQIDSKREGMVEGFTLGSYLLLVDYTARLLREGKALLTRDLAGIFDRLGCSAASWQRRLWKLSAGPLLGRFLAASQARLREVAARLGVQRLVNVGGCPAG
jgi:REP element-mobilizing transposase RayT